MDFYSIAPGIIIALGILGVLSGLLIFLSCRCFPGLKIARKLTNNEKYQRFFKTHCSIWWIFLTLMVVHVVVALLYFLTPF